MTLTAPTLILNNNGRTVAWPDWRRNKLSPLHHRIYSSNAKKMLINAGRGMGKDHIMFLRALRIAFELYSERKANPNWIRYGPVVNMMVVAHVSTNFEDLWRRFKKVCPDLPGVAADGSPNVHVLEKSQTVTIFGRDEIVIQFASVIRGDNIRGGGLDILCATEAAYINERTLTSALFPLVLGRPGYAGYVMLNSSPRGPGAYWDSAILQARKKKGYWGDWQLHEGCYVDNPMCTSDNVQEHLAVKAQNLDLYRRERLGWINVTVVDDALLAPGENRAFTPEIINAALVTETCKHKPPYYIGCDIAGTGNDKLALVVIDSQGLVCHVELHSKTSTEEVVDIFERADSYWHPLSFSYDGTGPLGKALQGRLHKIRANPVIVGRNKGEMVKHMHQHLINHSIKIPHPQFWDFGDAKYQRGNINTLITELRSYRRYELQSQHMSKGQVNYSIYETFSKPPGGTDDAVDALVMALQPRAVPVALAPTQINALELWA